MHEEKLGAVKYPTCALVNDTPGPAHQETIQASVASVTPVKRLPRSKKDKGVPDTIDRLNQDEEQKALNSVFLL